MRGRGLRAGLLWAAAGVLAGACGAGGESEVEFEVEVESETESESESETETETESESETETESAVAWSAPAGTTWAIQYSGVIDTSPAVAMATLDLFDTDDAVFAAFRAGGAGIVCYFSAGSTEDWRPDADQFPTAAIGKPLDGWPGERWLDIRDSGVRTVLLGRLDRAVTRHCDGVDPDNVNGHDNDTGFGLTRADLLAFNRWLASEAHARGLAIGLKNGPDMAAELEPDFDWELSEECLDFGECDDYAPFIAAGKAVFHLEYVASRADGPARRDAVCTDPRRAGFSTLIKTLDLDAWALACPR